MEKKKVLVSGPIFTQSGYGEHARFILNALRTRSDLFDIYAEPTVWGKCRWILKDTDEIKTIHQLVMKTHGYFAASQGNPVFDVSVQVKLPIEWRATSMVNIGVTSGIEATKVLPSWDHATNLMDAVIVESEFVKKGFDTTVPIKVVSFPERFCENKKPIEGLDLETDFNFLAVSHLIPRKNLEQTVAGFLEEFSDCEDVGLVVKVGMGADSLADKEIIDKAFHSFLSAYPNRKCKIYFVFGILEEEQLSWLYSHPKIKAMVSTTHGEGFGLPLFEAACHGLPVVAPLFGGQEDFLTMPVKDSSTKREPACARVDYIIDNVKPEHTWQGVLESSQSWAFPDHGSYKGKLRSMRNNYGAFKKKAGKLQKYLLSTLTKEAQSKKIVDLVLELIEDNSF